MNAHHKPDAAPVLLREDAGGIALLTLNRPQARNPLSEAMLAALSDAFRAIAADRSVKVVVLSAAGPVFSAGHDLKEMTAHRADPDRGRAYFADILGRCSAMMQQITALPQPVIAAVEGTATAAGCQLVGSCDLAVAGEDARFCTPGVHIGLFCSTPMVALSRNLSAKQAMEMLLTGETIDAATARLAARKARETARRKSVFESASMPDKLKDCTSKDPSISEIFLVEGDSAGGSAVRGRDPETQAILSLRGKVLNVEKARLDRALGNNEIQAIISAFGCGIGEDFDVAKARYHKIVLMADADVDGQHITTLLLTLLFRYMRGLIEAGFVYLAMPPLFRLKWSNAEHEYVFSDRERDALLADGLANGKRMPKDSGIQRYKGLGEMNPKELWETTMDHNTRTLRQVTIDDAAAADEIFSVLMGEDVESRRSFIQRNAKDVRFLDI